MINPEDMTFLQSTYFMCSLGVALAAKQKNKKLIKIFGSHGSMCMHGCMKEAKIKNISEDDIIEFMQLAPNVANYMCNYTEEDNDFLAQVLKEDLGKYVNVDEFFNKDKTEIVMSEEDFNKFLNKFKKEGKT